MQTIKEDSEKLLSVIYSCNTKDQARVAFSYYKLWSKKHFNKCNTYSCWIDGKALGAFQVLIDKVI